MQNEVRENSQTHSQIGVDPENLREYQATIPDTKNPDPILKPKATLTQTKFQTFIILHLIAFWLLVILVPIFAQHDCEDGTESWAYAAFGLYMAGFTAIEISTLCYYIWGYKSKNKGPQFVKAHKTFSFWANWIFDLLVTYICHFDIFSDLCFMIITWYMEKIIFWIALSFNIIQFLYKLVSVLRLFYENTGASLIYSILIHMELLASATSFEASFEYRKIKPFKTEDLKDRFYSSICKAFTEDFLQIIIQSIFWGIHPECGTLIIILSIVSGIICIIGIFYRICMWCICSKKRQKIADTNHEIVEDTQGILENGEKIIKIWPEVEQQLKYVIEIIQKDSAIKGIVVTKPLDSLIFYQLIEFITPSSQIKYLKGYDLQIFERTAAGLSGALCANKCLRKLGLEGCKFNAENSEGMRAISNIFVNNDRVSHFEMSKSIGLTKDNLMALTPLISEKSSLQFLDLSNNQLEDLDFIQFIKCFSINCKIEEINISGNKLTEQSLEVFKEVAFGRNLVGIIEQSNIV